MADFLKAYARTGQYEGGWSSVASDRGGDTYFGVARKFFPHFLGWPIIDGVPNKKQGQIIDDANLRKHLKDFYRANFWAKIHGDEFKSQRVAEFVYDYAVNSGVNTAIMSMQKALLVSADGLIGPETIKAANNAVEAQLMDSLIDLRIEFVNRIVANNPSQAKFLRGWLSRITSFHTA